MIPSILAHQVRQGVKDFLRTTFPIATPLFHRLVDSLLQREEGIFQGPYLSIHLPFRRGKGGPDFFPHVPLKFPPYQHQEEAFERLSGDRLAGDRPRSTLVATGTGSGKTECFLYPILDLCRRHAGEPGIKAILIYPMNALASDQAGRLARIIWNNPNLRGAVTAGLFVGQSERDPRMVMAPDGIVTHKETLRLKPPDILLTNYKMLDYLLIRARDFPLWKHNSPETLRFLVVDELHTFDGAQGTDLACLIRRLKARLKTPGDYLCGVGTSATLGSDEEKGKLIRYAQEVFGEPFDESAVITESRVSAGEYLADSFVTGREVIPPKQAAALDPEHYDGVMAYLRGQHVLWFGEEIPEERFHEPGWRVKLGDHIKGHYFFQNLLKALDGKPRSYAELFGRLERVSPELRGAPATYRENLLNSLLALVSTARVWADEGRGADGAPIPEEQRKTGPFLHVRIQLWLRELRRMVGSVSPTPEFTFSDDLREEELKRHLPVVNCRVCGSTAWAGLKRQRDGVVSGKLEDFYRAFFSDDPKVTFLFPEEPGLRNRPLESEIKLFCRHCLSLSERPDRRRCPSCDGEELIPVLLSNQRTTRGGKTIARHDCPHCNAENGLTIMGSQAASLTSVMLAQLYSSGYNDDKKLLTFSDSVQDAAHRAGFFAARTYRFNLRTALQQHVQEGGAGLTLAELPGAFVRHWSEKLDEKRFITTFLAPNMSWFQDFDHLQAKGELPVGSTLRDDVERRIGWEIFSEYGFQARIGRTLEKSGSSIAFPDSEVFQRLVEKLLEVLHNEMGELRALDAQTLGRFLLGLVVHLKEQGAIFHPVLESFVEAWGSPFLLNRISWMPGFGKFSRTPSFLTTRSGTRFDLLLTRTSGRRTWCQAWAEKCLFPVQPMIRSLLERFYPLVLKGLMDQGVLEERRVKGDRIWGLNPQALRVGDRVHLYRCETCGHGASGAEADAPLWEGMSCLRFSCTGKYRREATGTDYYAKLYATGDLQRIFAREHTGLLTRDEREELERRFKADPRDREPWDPNLLSCTPTLEMGIDIGDLSTVLLCSVPPGQANYLQRIGRAGRRDGNALTLTVANARPHDLYFFASPEEMISGRVEPPGVFLNASAVLERQFTAFCFDRWVESGISETALPARVGQVLSSLEPALGSKFPHNLLLFIENRQTELLEHFIGLFSGSLDETSVEHLRRFVDETRGEGRSLRHRIVEGLHGLRKERDSLQKKVRLLRERIRRKEDDPARGKDHERELDELKREKSALQKLVSLINGRDTFNFFTDEGLIPNYAFPEAGVQLRSVIYRKKQKKQEGEGAYQTWVYEYERPASSAIAELAPAGHFYAGGRKVRVDQVDLSASEIETWRLCNNCSHTELVGTAPEKSSCPVCGSLLWSDEGQKRRMVRLRQVFAATSDRESRIGDDSEEREPSFYERQLLIDFSPEHVTDAYRMESDDLAFGFEFLSRAVFREINFGEKGEFGEKVTVAGAELPRKGFTLCRHCGKVQERPGTLNHALTCTSRSQDSPQNLMDCVYLYRDFSSEAVRILLPVTTFAGSEKKHHSFLAALQLGLKLKFGGSVDHLRVTDHEEPVPETSYRKKYLVIFDSVPGGTGYLKQLMRSEAPMMEVFQLALEELRSCGCNGDPEKDGCYRCVYAYRNSTHMTEISRNTAVELLSGILAQRDRLVRTDSLRHVRVNVLFDSELEARFVEALRRLRSPQLDVALTRQVVNGKSGFFLKIGTRAYQIEPQVKLGERDGVAVPCEADFVFRPARGQHQLKPVAVFTDGFLYHRERVGEDLAQRMAVARSGAYWVWSLTWKDVESRFQSQEDYFENLIDPGRMPGGRNFNALLDGYGLQEFKGAVRESAFSWLIRFLAAPEEERWRRLAYACGLGFLDARRFSGPEAIRKWLTLLEEEASPGFCSGMEESMRDCLLGLYGDEREGVPGLIRVFASVEKDSMAGPRAEGMRLFCRLRDEVSERQEPGFEAAWNGLLRAFNLFQFLPGAVVASSMGLRRGIYDPLPFFRWEAPAAAADSALDGEWEELTRLVEADLHGLLEEMASRDLPVPQAGYEWVSETGEILAQAELGWEHLKIAALRETELEYRPIFEADGWKIFVLSEVAADPEPLCAELRRRQEACRNTPQ